MIAVPVSSPADHEGEVKKPWWKIGYKRLGAVLSALGIVFALAQLPGKLEGLAGTIKNDLNLINTKRHPGSVVTFDRIGRCQFTKDRSIGGAMRAFGSPTC